MRTAAAIAAWIIYQGGTWEARAILDGLLVLAVFGWWAPVPAGVLAGAAFAQSLSHLVYGSVPNYFLHDTMGGTVAFNLPDVLLFAGVALACLSIAYRVGATRASTPPT